MAKEIKFCDFGLFPCRCQTTACLESNCSCFQGGNFCSPLCTCNCCKNRKENEQEVLAKARKLLGLEEPHSIKNENLPIEKVKKSLPINNEVTRKKIVTTQPEVNKKEKQMLIKKIKQNLKNQPLNDLFNILIKDLTKIEINRTDLMSDEEYNELLRKEQDTEIINRSLKYIKDLFD
ncbi:hypothetical protein EHI8A_006390 [Entamoeba histolytica HM-1:IMSS-B]|uniref:CRC domain-containing protein n=6 Tax=Entamoeba histolytica TaxID=5759 RepID=C4LSC5_ENTH1|nr:hypothetical protein EHI_153340 [Entamoeba histolytica HM-1:IMSS]EMD45288.1 Hypothetical protein EHI5A_018850 [Entamoeba histolytica KU27]EMH74400.1 hypothetical protein EHI8A_006390 [Entamoeba histolytica HM-1:IMSS-B]EMS17386.1 hypothetical protein KM1_019490 [Entamoeba histolytica HM-3:IMSS]ENY63970.1 hypothetical protein EHI7A_007150 [Entamoeba histolytica HM-1:IMSS-A]GAT91590.1 hypothetical protein CL6EHI_153340 [Entamoeba histolytica]|eukprot:XP_656381.1 hypothetical protein EHI_153340 [Entamoeba histolytica HM-1:IMSS]